MINLLIGVGILIIGLLIAILIYCVRTYEVVSRLKGDEIPTPILPSVKRESKFKGFGFGALVPDLGIGVPTLDSALSEDEMDERRWQLETERDAR